ncbi:MAG: cupin domain-containing protein, partial [Candidatus Omnitrophica bacterium]|nr:cupin domain-containing protein [Candidatus Omnitrophota bacterium]
MMTTPPQGEIFKLGPPAAGEVIITVDPSRAGASFAAGTQALVSRAEIPVHRHLDRDEMLFIYKGQGRAILGGQTIIVVPGVTFHVPRGTWFSLRNTGTGALQFVWVSSPGLEAFFRDLS